MISLTDVESVLIDESVDLRRGGGISPVSIAELQEECLVALPMRYETDASADVSVFVDNTLFQNLSGGDLVIGVGVQVGVANGLAIAIDVHPSFTFNFG